MRKFLNSFSLSDCMLMHLKFTIRRTVQSCTPLKFTHASTEQWCACPAEMLPALLHYVRHTSPYRVIATKDKKQYLDIMST